MADGPGMSHDQPSDDPMQLEVQIAPSQPILKGEMEEADLVRFGLRSVSGQMEGEGAMGTVQIQKAINALYQQWQPQGAGYWASKVDIKKIQVGTGERLVNCMGEKWRWQKTMSRSKRMLLLTASPLWVFMQYLASLDQGSRTSILIGFGIDEMEVNHWLEVYDKLQINWQTTTAWRILFYCGAAETHAGRRRRASQQALYAVTTPI